MQKLLHQVSFLNTTLLLRRLCSYSTSRALRLVLFNLRLGAAACGVMLVACDGSKNYGPQEDRSTPLSRDEKRYEGYGKFFGPDLKLLNLGSSGSASAGNPIVGNVNGYLWQATLDTLAFAPMASTDATGGVIITDWYVSPDAPAERHKITVRITDRKLHANALKVTIFKQAKVNGSWVDRSANAALAEEFETMILNRARDMKVAEKASS